MSIDGVGKPGGSLPPIGPGSVGSTSGAQRREQFAVSTTSGAERVGGTDALARLGSGELGIDEYLELRLSEATAHLVGKLPTDQLEFVRQTLREQLNTDPVLVELVRRTTGTIPSGGAR